MEQKFERGIVVGEGYYDNQIVDNSNYSENSGGRREIAWMRDYLNRLINTKDTLLDMACKSVKNLVVNTIHTNEWNENLWRFQIQAEYLTHQLPEPKRIINLQKQLNYLRTKWLEVRKITIPRVLDTLSMILRSEQLV